MCTTKLQLLKQHDPGKKKKKRHKYRPKKESTEPRNKSTHLLTTDLLTKVPRTHIRERQSLYNGFGKTSVQNTETGIISLHIQKSPQM